jgi:hypothetical protein
VPDAARIDRIARLEKIKAAAGALQMAESVRFAQAQADAQLAADVHPDKIGRGIADQLGLACRGSGFEAAPRLGVAWGLWFELPEPYRLLVAGEISEYVASLVVTETRHLDANTRRVVDAKISAARISQMGPRSAAACWRPARAGCGGAGSTLRHSAGRRLVGIPSVATLTATSES